MTERKPFLCHEVNKEIILLRWKISPVFVLSSANDSMFFCMFVLRRLGCCGHMWGIAGCHQKSSREGRSCCTSSWTRKSGLHQY